MSTFFLEIYSEEIPSDAQVSGEIELKKALESFLVKNKIKFSNINSFSTSRRIIIFSRKVSKQTESETLEIRGPRTESNKNAIEGFLKSNNINFSDLIKRKIKDIEYFFYLKKSSPIKLNTLLEKNLNEILSTIKWKKSMRWGSLQDKWIRPIRNILCVFDYKIIKFNFAGLDSVDYSFGNYHYNISKIKFRNIDDYLKKLKTNFVIVDRNERKKIIYKKLYAFCNKENFKRNFDDTQIEKIANTVEYPNIYFGKFDKSFFLIPSFLIQSILTEKQDYFYFQKENGELSNYFGFATNKKNTKMKSLIIGNERVLKARFSDAIFFLNEDKKKTFQERLDLLNGIIFYENIGTLFDRSLRIKTLIRIISKKVNFKILKNQEDFLQFSNVDLTTEVVKEFPSLQGKVGGYYLSLQGVDKELCMAFSEQYSQNFDQNNNNVLSFIISIAQKIDAVIGFFLSGKKLTGAGDPFGLRRSVLSIIKISIEKKINLNYLNTFKECENLYKKQGIKTNLNFSSLIEFFNKRILIYLNEIGFDNDLIKINLSEGSLNPYLIKENTKIIGKFVNSSLGKSFLGAFNRLNSILGNKNYDSDIDQSLLNEKEEIKLFKSIGILKKSLDVNKSLYNLDELKNLYILTDPINEFLDNIKVNVEDIKLKRNRNSLLFHCREILNLYYKFNDIDFGNVKT